tara:strand:- start:368 stop:619 length:252 start_codon:yes stop_codon:yes gene_type:complete
MTNFEAQLLEVLTDISGHLANINKELETISSNTDDIRSINDGGNDCSSDIAKNIVEIGLDMNQHLRDIGDCLEPKPRRRRAAF